MKKYVDFKKTYRQLSSKIHESNTCEDRNIQYLCPKIYNENGIDTFNMHFEFRYSADKSTDIINRVFAALPLSNVEMRIANGGLYHNVSHDYKNGMENGTHYSAELHEVTFICCKNTSTSLHHYGIECLGFSSEIEMDYSEVKKIIKKWNVAHPMKYCVNDLVFEYEKGYAIVVLYIRERVIDIIQRIMPTMKRKRVYTRYKRTRRSK